MSIVELTRKVHGMIDMTIVIENISHKTIILV